MDAAGIEALAARANIVDVITELFVATDQRDWAAVKRCFADQVLFDMSSLGAGPPARRTPDEIAAGWAEGLSALAAIHHQAGNYRVTIHEARATANCYGIAYHYRKTASGRNTRVFVGSYAFILERGGALGWRISTFRFDLKFIDGNADLEGDG
ncbi:MAG TPA: nuclear transport factor 2 family protein [Polyangia bacterium]|nr:nuclear transport factor 2 family protein [Polyangia bacterium]